eukprot:TRINITY_DN18707_c0_g1_i2.p2 TRINITY_DN18707_c0_g1~~TRINITY_DN18707_c0_g1_i2.p2  ORF type:complete len:179 (+),score=31.97 TRINITY_DN18707_c0_g1_i2:105-641(+)
MWTQGDITGSKRARKKLLRTAREEADGTGWVVDGSYVAGMREFWGKADMIVFVDPSPLRRIWQATCREWSGWASGSNQVGAQGLIQVPMAAYRATGLSRVRRDIFDYLRKLKTHMRESYSESSEAEVYAGIRETAHWFAGTAVREAVPVLVLRSEQEVQAWLDRVLAEIEERQATHAQ